MTTSTRAVISFPTDTGGTLRLSVPKANAAMTEAEAKAGSAALRATFALCDRNGNPIDDAGVTLVSTARERIA